MKKIVDAFAAFDWSCCSTGVVARGCKIGIYVYSSITPASGLADDSVASSCAGCQIYSSFHLYCISFHFRGYDYISPRTGASIILQ